MWFKNREQLLPPDYFTYDAAAQSLGVSSDYVKYLVDELHLESHLVLTARYRLEELQDLQFLPMSLLDTAGKEKDSLNSVLRRWVVWQLNEFRTGKSLELNIAEGAENYHIVDGNLSIKGQYLPELYGALKKPIRSHHLYAKEVVKDKDHEQHSFSFDSRSGEVFFVRCFYSYKSQGDSRPYLSEIQLESIKVVPLEHLKEVVKFRDLENFLQTFDLIEREYRTEINDARTLGSPKSEAAKSKGLGVYYCEPQRWTPLQEVVFAAGNDYIEKYQDEPSVNQLIEHILTKETWSAEGLPLEVCSDPNEEYEILINGEKHIAKTELKKTMGKLRKESET